MKTGSSLRTIRNGRHRRHRRGKVSGAGEIAAALEAFYGKAAEPVWVSGGDVNDKARAFCRSSNAQANTALIRPTMRSCRFRPRRTQALQVAVGCRLISARSTFRRRRACSGFAAGRQPMTRADAVRAGPVGARCCCSHRTWCAADRSEPGVWLPRLQAQGRQACDQPCLFASERHPMLAPIVEGLALRVPQFQALKAELAKLQRRGS